MPPKNKKRGRGGGPTTTTAAASAAAASAADDDDDMVLLPLESKKAALARTRAIDARDEIVTCVATNPAIGVREVMVWT